MDRENKIDYLKKLAAGKLSPADLLALLPERLEIWQQKKDGTFDGPGGKLTKEELNNYRSKYAGPVRRLLITRRSLRQPTGQL